MCLCAHCLQNPKPILSHFLHTMTILLQWLLVVVVAASSFSLVLFWFALVLLSLRCFFVFSLHDSLFIYLHLMTISSSLSSYSLQKQQKRPIDLLLKTCVRVSVCCKTKCKNFKHIEQNVFECCYFIFFFLQMRTISSQIKMFCFEHGKKDLCTLCVHNKAYSRNDCATGSNYSKFLLFIALKLPHFFLSWLTMVYSPFLAEKEKTESIER